ncbi:hypothetical protein EPD60_02830 [Flaviaesturariibacter flavus]|uniref:Outer membrane protein beta-barrel domain-containing protein n=1 Tax=Flaviaesturariibacter flavus TaxID=2502780 RepID=A0A4R1BP56_9BACT|nr:hypothetical protein [Flaviaesturariibacter flavus]TCJ19364.1 hypothetical protein EPD60_02830 [Flaviaesturariibacter flavus]
MKNKTICIALLTGLLLTSSAAGVAAQHAAKSVFVELGGPGLTSVNFDSRFTKKDGGIGGRAGVGYFNISGERLLLVPVGVNYLLSKDQRHYFELGAGVTVVDYKSDFFYEDPNRFTGTFGHLNFGYRLQPKEGGFMFRAAINPLFTSEGFFPYYGGISFGYAF